MAPRLRLLEFRSMRLGVTFRVRKLVMFAVAYGHLFGRKILYIKYVQEHPNVHDLRLLRCEAAYVVHEACSDLVQGVTSSLKTGISDHAESEWHRDVAYQCSLNARR